MLARLVRRRVKEPATAAPSGRRRGVSFAFVLLALVTAGAAGASPRSLTGLSLPEALDELRARGIAILFSSALVRSDMEVLAEPAGGSPAELLADLLRPHGLAVRNGRDGTLLVVPARLPPTPPRFALRGTVSERETGIALPGVEIVLAEARARVESAADGTFVVEGLAAGVYSLEAAKLGFVRQRLENIRIGPGSPAEIAVRLLPLPLTLDEIEVVPELEVGSIHNGTLLHSAELARVPTPRDPWAVVTQAAAVLSDRINVGGSESGAQALFLAPASGFSDNVFTLDGVDTTDMAALGSSAIYYDFDQFQELQVSTGGADVRTSTAGVTVRMITKRGTDAPRGSGRLLSTDAGGLFGLFAQGSSALAGKLAPGQVDAESGNEVDRILDDGLELGGPLIRDRLWAWGSYGRNAIDLVTVGGLADDTLLENAAFKLNANPGRGNSLVASVNYGDKRKRNRGAGPSRSLESAWRQYGPTEVYKLEDSQVVGRSLFLTGSYDVVDGGFSLIPNGGAGLEGRAALQDADGVWKNGYYGGTSDRDSRTVELSGSIFLGRHTLDAGASARAFRYADDYRWPGPNQAFQVACENVGTCGPDSVGDLVGFERRGVLAVDAEYAAAWLQDNAAAGRWSFSAGLRLDVQQGNNPPGMVDANPAIPEALPGLTFEGDTGIVEWTSVSPRLAASYTVDEEGRTVLRVSLGRFAGRLGTSDIRLVNPLESSELLYGFRDANGDRIWQPGEPLRLIGSVNVDPEDRLVSANHIDPGLDPELTDELLAGVERMISNDWVLGLNLTLRRASDISERRPLVRDGNELRVASADDYLLERTVAVTLPDGRPRVASFYAIRPPLVRTGGELLTNGDRAREYRGIALSMNRRPSDRFMMRGYLALGEATWRVPEDFFRMGDPTDLAGAGDNDGDLYAAQSRGLRSGVFVQSSWSAQWSGYYRIAPRRKWGFTVSSSVFARQGYPLPYMALYVSGVDGVGREGQVTDGIDEFRADDIFTVDLSLEKEIRFAGGFEATLSLAAFNVMNEGFVLQRERNLTSPRADFVEETLAPRIFRFGVRLAW